jgi:hypothetical protein
MPAAYGRSSSNRWHPRSRIYRRWKARNDYLKPWNPSARKIYRTRGVLDRDLSGNAFTRT